MFGSKSPIETAYYDAVGKLILSMVYFALNEGVPGWDLERFRADWTERGSFRLAELLHRCARPDWASHPETFFMNPWIAERLLAVEPGRLCYVLDEWLADRPLPELVSDDPRVEERKVKELAKLFAALNR